MWEPGWEGCLGENGYMYMYGWVSSLFIWNYHKIFVNWLCQVSSVVFDSVQPCRRQPTRLPRPWDSPGKNTGVGCHFLLQRTSYPGSINSSCQAKCYIISYIQISDCYCNPRSEILCQLCQRVHWVSERWIYTSTVCTALYSHSQNLNLALSPVVWPLQLYTNIVPE